MIGVALSDLHLGYAGAGRLVGGRSGREIDVEVALGHCVDRIVEVQPDLVTIAGDVFHSIRPSYHAVRALQMAVRTIIEDTNAHLVVIPGNHESPRTAAALSPNVVIADSSDRVHYIDQVKTIIVESWRLAERVAVTCAPFSALGSDQSYRLEPFDDADVNVLLIHAAVRTSADPRALPHFYGSQGIDIGREAERWDAICCGDYHNFVRLHPTALAFYSGAIERTSSNIWQEAMPKCVVKYDTEARTLEPLEIPTRGVSDMGALLRGGVCLNESLEEMLRLETLRDRIVRFKTECERGQRDSINWKAVRELKTRCFHFQLDIDWIESDVDTLPVGAGPGRRSLRDDAERFFDGDPDRALAFEYLGLNEKAAA